MYHVGARFSVLFRVMWSYTRRSIYFPFLMFFFFFVGPIFPAKTGFGGTLGNPGVRPTGRFTCFYDFWRDVFSQLGLRFGWLHASSLDAVSLPVDLLAINAVRVPIHAPPCSTSVSKPCGLPCCEVSPRRFRWVAPRVVLPLARVTAFLSPIFGTHVVELSLFDLFFALLVTVLAVECFRRARLAWVTGPCCLPAVCKKRVWFP